MTNYLISKENLFVGLAALVKEFDFSIRVKANDENTPDFIICVNDDIILPFDFAPVDSDKPFLLLPDKDEFNFIELLAFLKGFDFFLEIAKEKPNLKEKKNNEKIK